MRAAAGARMAADCAFRRMPSHYRALLGSSMARLLTRPAGGPFIADRRQRSRHGSRLIQPGFRHPAAPAGRLLSTFDDSLLSFSRDEEQAATLQPQQATSSHLRLHAAFRAGTLGFGFSAGGFLYPYHCGVLWELQDLRILHEGSQAHFAGASAGSLAITVFNSGLGVADATQHLLDFALHCRRSGTRFRLSSSLRSFLTSYLPDDAHTRCSGTTHIAVTRVLPYLQPQLISQFDSKADLVEALLASCHIPVYSDGRWWTSFRGGFYMDGGVANFIPSPPDAELTVKVSCLPVAGLLSSVKQRIDGYPRLASIASLLDVSISPDAFEAWPYDYATLRAWAFSPAPDHVLHDMIGKGRRDARHWATQTGLLAVAAQLQQQQQQQQQARGSSNSDDGIAAGDGMAAAPHGSGPTAAEQPKKQQSEVPQGARKA